MFLVSTRLFFIFLFFIKPLSTERRIKGGSVLETHKPYVVYLIKAPPSVQRYDTWLCGGAIVSPWYIITSAACVEDVQHVYAVAGYRRYVDSEKLNEDKCTKEMKKKIVFTCVPKLYELDYARLERWSLIDIALTRVESAFDFNDEKYITLCTYKPTTIPVNYDAKYQEPGVDAIVLGWGHLKQWRKPEDTGNYNQEIINYAPVLIRNKNDCKSAYSHYKGMATIIDKYMICTMASGNIDANGDQIEKGQPLAQGCVTREEKLMGREGMLVRIHNDHVTLTSIPLNLSPRKLTFTEHGTYFMIHGQNNLCRVNITESLRLQQCNETGQQVENEYEQLSDYMTFDKTRRRSALRQSDTASGICQNDHGGPLVTWVGSHEILIGVASVFRVNDRSHCVGPFLFTSTQCNGAFIGCILENNNTRRMEICEKPLKEKGYVTVERTISWMEHPDGPADNEMPPVRPQIPIWKYG